MTCVARNLPQQVRERALDLDLDRSPAGDQEVRPVGAAQRSLAFECDVPNREDFGDPVLQFALVSEAETKPRKHGDQLFRRMRVRTEPEGIETDLALRKGGVQGRDSEEPQGYSLRNRFARKYCRAHNARMPRRPPIPVTLESSPLTAASMHSNMLGPCGEATPADFEAWRHPVLAVPCPTCLKRAGVWCERPSGHRGMDFHSKRKMMADR